MTPRWQRLRRALFALSAVTAAGFVLAVAVRWNGTSLLFLILLWGLLSVAVPLPHLPGLARVFLKPLPGLLARAERLLDWLEFAPAGAGAGKMR